MLYKESIAYGLEDASKACIEFKERIDISDINAYGIDKSCCIKKVNAAAYC